MQPSAQESRGRLDALVKDLQSGEITPEEVLRLAAVGDETAGKIFLHRFFSSVPGVGARNVDEFVRLSGAHPRRRLRSLSRRNRNAILYLLESDKAQKPPPKSPDWDAALRKARE